MRAETEKEALMRKMEDSNMFSLSNEKTLNEEQLKNIASYNLEETEENNDN